MIRTSRGWDMIRNKLNDEQGVLDRDEASRSGPLAPNSV